MELRANYVPAGQLYLQIGLVSKQVGFDARQSVTGDRQRLETSKISEDERVEPTKSILGQRQIAQQAQTAERFRRHATDVGPGKV